MLWCNLCSTTIKGLGFEINPHDRCVANKTIEGTQWTIAWYVDDNKLSQKNPALISNIIEEIRKHLGDLSVVRENKKTFLGMNAEINNNIIHIDMVR